MLKENATYFMPDGTSRAKVGKKGTSLVHVGEKVRTLKLQGLGADTTDNWENDGSKYDRKLVSLY